MSKRVFWGFILLLLLNLNCKKQESRESANGLTMNEARARDLQKNTEYYLNAWSKNDTVLHRQVTARKMIRNLNGKIVSVNQNGLLKSIEVWHRALPDFKMIEKEIITVGNRAFVNWAGTGTNTGMFGEHAPTGKKIHIEGFSVLTFDDSGLIVHEAVFYDLLGVMQEWGYTLLPPIME